MHFCFEAGWEKSEMIKLQTRAADVPGRKCKVIRSNRNEFFVPNRGAVRNSAGNDEMHRQRIEQFVGKMNSNERRDFVNRRKPGSFFGELAQISLLALSPNRKRLDHAIGSCGKTIGGRSPQRTQRIGCKNAIMRTLLHDFEIARPPKLLPNFGKLGREQSSEERSNTDVGEKITPPANVGPTTGVIPAVGVIKRQLHEASEGDRALRANLITDNLD